MSFITAVVFMFRHVLVQNCIDKVESGVMENGLYFKAWYERPWEFESRKSFKGYEGVVKVVNRDGDIEMNSDQSIHAQIILYGFFYAHPVIPHN